MSFVEFFFCFQTVEIIDGCVKHNENIRVKNVHINVDGDSLIDSTNIETSEDEMKVLDEILFRCWQMGWLDKYDDGERREP